MASGVQPPKQMSGFMKWLLDGQVKEREGPHEGEHQHHQQHWYKVMCLTGVDYFSTLGYQPGIAALAAGALSPVATLILVLLTLFGALPMYKRVAERSPHGDGSISMLENLLSFWPGKLFVLCLIGFAATGFIITITLSAADASAHVIENPLAPAALKGQNVLVTFVLIALLGAIFLKGFGEAINIAVPLVVIYILLNIVVISQALTVIYHHPQTVSDWKSMLLHGHGNPLLMVGAALLLFPKLALGLSGFETGVVVMPLVKGDPTDTDEHPKGRIKNTHKLLTTAAIIMSILLLASSFVTTILIPAEAFRPAAAGHPAGEANGRALAYLAHKLLGETFGTAYDASTILILWFAGSSAMAGLLNIVPRYLPRYGMAPDWTKAPRPLVIIFTAICFAITILFKADVDAQGGAYATGVLALMTSATVAVTLYVWRQRWIPATVGFAIVTLIFIYTTVVNIVERPDGLKIALIFIGLIIVTSLISRVSRTTELRVDKMEIDEKALEFIQEAAETGDIRIIANKLQGNPGEHEAKEQEQRRSAHIPPGALILFLEVEVVDPSTFSGVLKVRGVEVDGYPVLRVEAAVVPNAIAYMLLYIRDKTGKVPHAYFSWSDETPIMNIFRYIFLGQGDTAPVTHEVLRQAEPDPDRRPAIHVGGER
jgi:hypothetical protein